MNKFIFQSDETSLNKRLDIFLQNNLENTSRQAVQKLIEEKNVSLNSNTITKSSYKLKGNETIEVTIPIVLPKTIEKENIPLDIIYEDEHIGIINKPHNMTVHPAQDIYTGTLVNGLLYHFDSLSTANEDITRPGIVHRLDKNTSGLIVIAKTNEAYFKLIDMFKDKNMKKTYVTICKGNFKDKEGRLENLIGRDPLERKRMAVVEVNGKIAISNYTILDEVKDFSLVKVHIETGRTHQIRVHMKSLNHPILGDDTYGSASSLASRQMLHAYSLEFNHPITNEFIHIIAPLPEDMTSLLKKLNLDFDKVKI